jgi:hypothetical protein
VDRRKQNQINLGLTCWNLVTGVTSALLTKMLNRRTQYLIAFVGMTAIFACWTGASAEQTTPKHRISKRPVLS